MQSHLDSDFRWTKIKATGVLLLGISAIISAAATIILATLAYSIQNHAECENDLAAEMRASIGAGLAAVAEGNDEELEDSAGHLRELSQRTCE